MRILFFSNAFPNPLSPRQGTFNRLFIRTLAEDHVVRVVSPIPWTQELKALLKRQGKVSRHKLFLVDGVRVEFPRYWYTPKVGRKYYAEFMYRSCRKIMSRLISQYQPDVLVSYWSHPDGEVTVRMAQQAGIPSVVMVGGSDLLVLAQQGRQRREAIFNVYHQADAVVAVSKDIAKELIAGGISTEKVHVVRRGVDSEIFHSGDKQQARKELSLNQKDKILVTAARLEPVKGMKHLIDASQILKQRGLSHKCYILGDGALRTELSKQIENLGLQDCVKLVGSRNQGELATWYQAADLFVLPSLSEGIPNVLMEAMSCGSRFVATQVGGIPEIADPNFDRLVPPANSQAFADAIEESLQLPDYPEQRWFTPQSWAESGNQFTKVMQSVCENRQEAMINFNREATVSELAATADKPLAKHTLNR